MSSLWRIIWSSLFRWGWGFVLTCFLAWLWVQLPSGARFRVECVESLVLNFQLAWVRQTRQCVFSEVACLTRGGMCWGLCFACPVGLGQTDKTFFLSFWSGTPNSGWDVLRVLFWMPSCLRSDGKDHVLTESASDQPFWWHLLVLLKAKPKPVCSVWQQRWDTWRLSFFTSSTASRLSRTSFFKPGGRKSVVHFKQNPQSSIWSCLPVGPSVPRRLVHETPETPDDCLFLPAALPIVSHKPNFLSVIGSQWCTLSKTLSLQFDRVFLWGRACREG